jgi:porin
MKKGVIRLASPVCPILRNVVTVIGLFAGLVTSIAQQPFAEWWNGKYASGDWFGVRDTLEDHGLNLKVEWKANFLWNVDGGLQQRFGYDDEWKFTGNLNFDKLTGWDPLLGLTATVGVRYRGGAGVNKWVGASNEFAPSTFQGGRLWRFLYVYLTYTTPELFGVKDFLTLSGGWQNPADFFITQPENKFFINNTFNSGRGFAANGFSMGRQLFRMGRLH